MSRSGPYHLALRRLNERFLVAAGCRQILRKRSAGPSDVPSEPDFGDTEPEFGDTDPPIMPGDVDWDTEPCPPPSDPPPEHVLENIYDNTAYTVL